MAVSRHGIGHKWHLLQRGRSEYIRFLEKKYTACMLQVWHASCA
eukprot:jgi/Botrbrau1/14332/Bobra.0222s0004.1